MGKTGLAVAFLLVGAGVITPTSSATCSTASVMECSLANQSVDAVYGCAR